MHNHVMGSVFIFHNSYRSGLCLPSQVTSISMEGVLVGEDLNGCAFVYGSLSFVDKVSCGIALYILESYQGNAFYLVVVVNLITLVLQSEFCLLFASQEVPRLVRIKNWHMAIQLRDSVWG
jgi:hypothetical protein